MTAQNLIVVIGATGGQGGSVVDTFLNEPNWRVRGITRNSSSRKAEALKRRGVEVVQANLDDPASLVPAFEGANAIFLVSDFWAIYNELAGRPNAHPGKSLNEQAKERETQQLNNAIDVAAELPSLSRLVISSLPHAAKLTAGKYAHIYHYESKADAEDYAKEKYPDLWSKTSVFKGGFFLSNFTDHPMSQPTKVSTSGSCYASRRVLLIQNRRKMAVFNSSQT
jgi:NAD(P)-dependent dehydrogenase (short-subunit alcohol dehydrogenase family)